MNKDKNEKNIINPNPDLNRCTYNFNKEVGVSLNELNEGYAFYYCYDNQEIYKKIKEKQYKQDLLKEQIKSYEKSIQELNNNISEIKQEINTLDVEIQKELDIIKETSVLDTPAVIKAQGRVMKLVSERNKKLSDENIKHWNVKKISFEQVKTIADEENAPVRAVIQKININVLKTHFTGVNRYIK